MVDQLVVAAGKGQTQLCRDLVAKGAEIDYQTTQWRQTALGRAASGGHFETCEALLERGASLEFPEHFGWVPLHRASGSGHVAICSLFLDRGANVMARSFTGESPLNCAVSNGHAAVSMLLLDRGADIESRDEANRTPLIQASARAAYGLSEMLLQRGALTEAKDQFGQTAIVLAANNASLGGRGDLRSALILMAYGADASRIKDPISELTPIQAAAMGGFSGRLMKLLDEQAESRSADRMQGLRQLALDAGHLDTVAAIDSVAALSVMSSIARHRSLTV